jgi:cytochrome c
MSRLVVPMLAAAALLVHSVPAVAGDAAAGQRVFAQCRACHTVDNGGRNGVGPNLWGVFGAPAAKKEGARYSANMQELAAGGLTWTAENLSKYLENPKSLVPRGSMAFAGLRNPEQRANVIAYLETLK